jgi:L-alanine-DL-glutamate epimerase-like enolase superfamily enzyme
MMRIVEVSAFPVVVAAAGKPHAGAAGVSGAWSDPGRYARVLPYRPLYSRDTETVFVRIRTDDGSAGWGESQAPVAGRAVATIVEELVAPVLLGRDARDHAVLRTFMYDAMRDRGHGGGFMLDAIAGADIALWDLSGRHYGEPVARLLGGAYAREVPVYLSGPRGSSVEQRLEDAQTFVDRGFKAVKLFAGRGVGPDLAEVARFRDRFGSGIELLVDAQWRYSRADALLLGRGLQELGVQLLETPINPEDVEGHADLARSLDLPIALGETERTCWQVLPFLHRSAVDVLQPDVGRCGITEARRIALLAELHNVPVALHCGVGFGPYIAASIHVAAAVPNLLYVEYQPDMHELAGSYGWSFELEDGRLRLPGGAGLGIGAPPEALLSAP